MDKFLEAKASVDEVDENGRSALMLASMSGHAKMVRKLFNANASLNHVTTAEGMTALMLAAESGHTDVIDQLLHLKADLTVEDKNGATAITLAEKKKRHRVLDRLRAAQLSLQA
mmetsp:Transcript_18383/g.41575  ORF Transcript_18383/g.41575 Transcript_18383/m.41575 type:complete len:114 (-) Transcript_18383:93-434(-)